MNQGVYCAQAEGVVPAGVGAAAVEAVVVTLGQSLRPALRQGQGPRRGYPPQVTAEGPAGAETWSAAVEGAASAAVAGAPPLPVLLAPNRST